MDRQIDNLTVQPGGGRKSSYNSGHLMCRTPLWGVAGFLGCAYFAWVSFSHVIRNEYEWPHDGWTVATYIVWILLLTGLAYDTRCLRERMFFGVLVINFLAGCGLERQRSIEILQIVVVGCGIRIRRIPCTAPSGSLGQGVRAHQNDYPTNRPYPSTHV